MSSRPCPRLLPAAGVLSREQARRELYEERVHRPRQQQNAPSSGRQSELQSLAPASPATHNVPALVCDPLVHAPVQVLRTAGAAAEGPQLRHLLRCWPQHRGRLLALPRLLPCPAGPAMQPAAEIRCLWCSVCHAHTTPDKRRARRWRRASNGSDTPCRQTAC